MARQTILQDIARLVQQDHVVLPLFEAQVLYGIRAELLWDIRLDGQIFASEITGNVVEIVGIFTHAPSIKAKFMLAFGALTLFCFFWGFLMNAKLKN